MEIGPQLPPDLACKIFHSKTDVRENDSTSDRHNEETIDSEIPTTGEHFDDDEVENDGEDVQNEELFGPVLPPGFKVKPTAVIGPCRPTPEVLGELETGQLFCTVRYTI